MTTTILKAIRDTLLADSTLTNLLGGNYIFTSEIEDENQFPSITLRSTNEKSKKRVGYSTFKTRDDDNIIQCDVWSKKSRHQTYQIATRMDAVLVADTVPDTRSWIKIGPGGDMFERDTRIYHKPIRYSYAYTITDS